MRGLFINKKKSNAHFKNTHLIYLSQEIAMNRNELLNLKEGLHVDIKSAQKGIPSNIYETFSAFANTDGVQFILVLKKVMPMFF